MKTSYVIDSLQRFVEEYGDGELMIWLDAGRKYPFHRVMMPVRSIGWSSDAEGLHIGARIVDAQLPADREARITIRHRKEERCKSTP